MKDYEVCKLLSVEYRNHSYYGNPSYYVNFIDSEGHFKRGYTGANYSCGYTIQNYKYCSEYAPIFLEYHFTKKAGNLIIDSIKHNSPDQAKEEFEKISA